MVLYIWLSIVVSVQFGSNTHNPCNLNWDGFRWPASWVGDTCDAGATCDWTAKAVEFIVLFTPALDVVSAYPFISIIVGNSLTEILLGTLSEDTSHKDSAGTGGNIEEQRFNGDNSNRSSDLYSTAATETTPLRLGESSGADSSIDISNSRSSNNSNTNMNASPPVATVSPEFYKTVVV